MPRKPKFRPVITRIKLNPEQAVLSCNCYQYGTVMNTVTQYGGPATVGVCIGVRGAGGVQSASCNMVAPFGWAGTTASSTSSS